MTTLWYIRYDRLLHSSEKEETTATHKTEDSHRCNVDQIKPDSQEYIPLI